MNREAELINRIGDPSSWDYLSWGGRDSHVFGSTKIDRVVKFYPYQTPADLNLYAGRTLLAASKLMLRHKDIVKGERGRLVATVRAPTIEMIGEAKICGDIYGYAVSKRIDGPDISQVSGNSDLYRGYQNRELIEFLEYPGNIPILEDYLVGLSRYISGDITMGNAKIVEESRGVYLYITDVLAKIGGRRRVYRNPLDIAHFGY